MNRRNFIVSAIGSGLAAFFGKPLRKPVLTGRSGDLGFMFFEGENGKPEFFRLIDGHRVFDITCPPQNVGADIDVTWNNGRDAIYKI